MEAGEPPTYSTPAISPLLSNITPFLLSISPLADTSFQTGEFLQGAVEIKTNDAAAATPDPPLEKLQVMFRGVEQRGEEAVVLYETSLDLWGNKVPSTSARPCDSPPASMPFKIALPSDLPHCIHLAQSSLIYSISATLFYSHTLPPLSRVVSIHLVRPSAPATTSTSTPQIESVDRPVSISVRLPKKAYHRREAIPISIRIEVPTHSRGLRLRNVNAELIRRIALPLEEPQLTLLARSGKSCRFSPSRPIIMRLLLHPPIADSSCESISQSSIFHNVDFFVKTTISVFSLDPTTPVSSPVITHSVQIVPDSSRIPMMVRSEKEREAEREEITSYGESFGEPSTSAMRISAPAESMTQATEMEEEQQKELEEEQEEEFDGYEDFSTDLVMPPPPIEEDVPPPTIEQRSSDSPAVLLNPNVEAASSPISSGFASALGTQSLELYELVGLVDLATTHAQISSPSTPSSVASPLAYSLASSDDQTPPPYFGDSLPVNQPVLGRTTGTSGPPPYSDSNLRS